MSPDAYAPNSGDAGYAVRQYRLRLRYRLATNRLDAEAEISAQALDDLAQFRLDLVGLKASRVEVDGDRRTGWRQGPNRLTITPPTPIPAGADFAVRVRYSGSPAPRGSRWGRVGWEELTDGVLVAAQPTGAATWFPCNDRTADKARYTIELTVEDGYTVVAPGRLVSRTSSSGRTTWSYVEDVPTATYLVAVQIGRYRTEPLELGGVPGRVHFPPALAQPVRAEVAHVGEMMALFERTFGPYPLDGYDLVVTPDSLDIPLEGQGMAVFGSNHLDGRFGSQRLLAHELAHQWFGNSVGVAQWRDIWLNEGFACYAEWLWSEESGGPSCHQQAKTHWELLAGLPQDLVLSDPGPALMFDDRVYKRGALCLHALRRVAGDASFFALLQEWVSTYRHATAGTADFRRLADQACTEPLDGLLTEWLDRPQLPKLPRRARPH